MCAMHLSVTGRSVCGQGAAFMPESLPLPQTCRHQRMGVYTRHIAVQCLAHPSGLRQNQPVPLYMFKIDNSCHKKAPSSCPGFNKTQVTGAFSLSLKGEIKVALVLPGARKGHASENFRHKTQTLELRLPPREVFPILQESAPAQVKQLTQCSGTGDQ